MRRIVLSVFVLVLFTLSGCAGHGSRHTEAYHIQPCPTFPCGGDIYYRDMELSWEVQRTPDDEFILSGTIMPRGVPEGTKVEFAQMSVELTRDLTIFDSFSFPVVTREMTVPLTFKHRFKPTGGFDGLTFNWDIHINR